MAATIQPPTPTSPASIEGALKKRSGIYLSISVGLIIATLWNTHSVSAAPAKLDSLDSTFPLDLQPPIYEATVSAASSTLAQANGDVTTIDSYGNPIESLQPIETPDGRKVVSAQGLQFEIPNYASGITELKKPADDLLPPFVDKIGSSSEEVGKKQRNPFLASFDDGKYRPNQTTRRTAGTATTSTTTTTTTTTPAPLNAEEENPFEPTIPPWLKDFDYTDLAPGVPFVYNPNEDENQVDENILPPSTTKDTNNSPSPSSSSSSTSPFSNSQTPQGFTNKFTPSSSSAISSASSSIPSIVTIPQTSSIQTQQDDSAVTRPPLESVPPPPTTADQTSSIFNKNFAEPFGTASATSSSMTPSSATKKIPLSADRESFPPFNNLITGSGSSTTAIKPTFTKSEDGKVITNNIFLSGSSGSATPASSLSSKPFGSTQTVNSQEKNTAAIPPFFTATTSASASGFVTAPSASNSSSSNESRYTGRFGGPPGVLAPQNTGFATAATNTTVTKAYNKPTFTTFGVTSAPGLATNNKDKFTGSFGGPPGVLKPYDNVKNR